MSSYGGRAPILLGISWAQATVATILVCLRAYTARSHSDRIRWDTFWVAIACAQGLVIQGLLVIATMNGVGNQLNKVKLNELWYGLKMTWMGVILSLGAAACAKLSIIALLLQVTTRTQPTRRYLLWLVAGFICMVNIAQAAVSLTQCSPANKLWNRLEPGHCTRATFANDFGIFQGAVAVASDVFLALYPTTVVWDLQISRRAKFAFCGLMAGGLLPAVAGILRTIYIHRLVSATDPTFELSPFLTWGLTEIWLIIILGSVPPLRPLFERVFRRAKAITGNNTHSAATDLEAIGSATRIKNGETVVTLKAVTKGNDEELLADEAETTEKYAVEAVTVVATDDIIEQDEEDNQQRYRFGDRRAG